MPHLSVDVETYSSVDLKKSGVYKYCESPDFQILLCAYSIDSGPVCVLDLFDQDHVNYFNTAFRDLLFTPNTLVSAYNAQFEAACFSRHFGIPITREYASKFRCTMVHGLYCGYPAGLEALGKALDFENNRQKMNSGKALIRYFCVPCRPTKTNGGRIRNLPRHDPEKWQLFKEYCAQDVVSEMAAADKLAAIPVPDFVNEERITDHVINARGVAADINLIRAALDIGYDARAALIEEAKNISGLNNPNSVNQLTAWLEKEMGEELPGVDKETVSKLLDREDNSDTIQRMLEIRQELGKTSTKKYDAAEAAVCADGRVRGLLQFYGANRTGRWAGRLVQTQNLPRTHIEPLSFARELVKAKQTDALRLVYGSVPDTLSQLIRTCFVASPGHVLVDVDFSSIEARIISWLAGEQWRLDSFKRGEDLYIAAASQMFGVPRYQIDKKSPLRQKGKVAELACVAAEQLVLTNKGLVPIENITIDMLIWDGVDYVKHDGVVYKGEKEVITYDGLTATPDHLVWIEGKQAPIRFENAAAGGARLQRSEYGWGTIRFRKDYQRREKMERRVERPSRINTVRKLRQNTMATSVQPKTWKIGGLPSVFTAATCTKMAGTSIHCCKTAMRKSERLKLSQLWKEGDSIPFQLSDKCRNLGGGKFRSSIARIGNGSNKQRRPLRTWKHSFCTQESQSSQSPVECNTGMETARVAVRKKCSHEKTIKWHDTFGDYTRGNRRGYSKTQKLAKDSRTAHVFDILNCGPRHRFTVNGVLVHNCGYQGGAGALIAMGALNMGLAEEELPEIVARWREANKRIRDLWYAMESAAIKVVTEGGSAGVGRVLFSREFDCDSGIDCMTILLPSGRKLYYISPTIAANQWGKPSVAYMGVDQTTKRWGLIGTYGGKLTENGVQAIARDCLSCAVERLEAAGFGIVMHCHDEVVIDCPEEHADLDAISALMARPMPWAPDLPLAADGWISPYFKKD